MSKIEIENDTTLEKSLVLEYFKAMRSEIELRVRNHTTLVTAKIVTAGGILAFLLSPRCNVEVAVHAFGILLVPIIAMLYDVMIGKNIRNINRMGGFVRDRIEPLAKNFRLWETTIAQKNRWDRCYGIADVIVLSGFTLGTILIAMLLLWDKISHMFIYFIWPFVVVGWLATTIYMGVCILGFDQPENQG